VSWDDFTQHVLRAGKTHLKPVAVGHSALEFKKAAKTSQPLPARNMWYLGVMDRLLVFENGSSSVRIFDGNLDQVARFDPLSGLARSRALKDSAILPYYGKRAKERAFVISTTDQDALCAKACVLAMAYLPPKKQVVVSTSDSTLTYWNTEMDYLYGHSIAPGPQVRHSILAFEPTFTAVVLTRKCTSLPSPSSPLLMPGRAVRATVLRQCRHAAHVARQHADWVQPLGHSHSHASVPLPCAYLAYSLRSRGMWSLHQHHHLNLISPRPSLPH
jgi:hypothetical protein